MKQKRAGGKKAHRARNAVIFAKQQGTKIKMAEKENREHKSSVFVDLFYENEKAVR